MLVPARLRPRFLLAAFGGFAAVALGWKLLRAAPESGPGIDPRLPSLASDAMLNLPIRVLNAEGNPVVGADVRIWALRSAQGHGGWSPKRFDGREAPSTVTDLAGRADLPYPAFAIPDERVGTLAVSVEIDHPTHALTNDLHLDVPLATENPHEVKLAVASPVIVRPMLDGEPAPLEGIYAQWSDGRSWSKHAEVQRIDGRLHLPPMATGTQSLRLVRLVNETATHFSPTIEFEVVAGKITELEVALAPAARIAGRLGDTIPRPVRNGRVKVRLLPPEPGQSTSLAWFTWARVDDEGQFEVTWPAGEAMQAIALCDGFCGASGAAPHEVENPRDPDKDPFRRPQVFRAPYADPIVIAMEPMVECVVTTVNDEGTPIPGVKVGSYPNVGWWNVGSQIYCSPLVRGETLLRKRDYALSIDPVHENPFRVTTDATGRATLMFSLNRYSKSLYAWKEEEYELPVILGDREVEVELVAGQRTEVTLRMQPVGTEQLGDWDKLAGVVFGCSTREGRRICALPGVRKKMDEFRRRIREADDPHDPAILAEAYEVVAEAFENADDPAEATKWRERAAEQAALATGDS